jgi:CRISPR-associated protein Cas1
MLEGNFLLREKQYTTTKGNDIAKQLVINKIENQRDFIKKIRSKDNKEGIKKLNEAIIKLKENDFNGYEIMGLEGTSAKVYFNRIFAEFNWQGRQPRVKRDELNLLLDIGYTVLFNYIEAILNLYGFDIYKGNLHKEFYKRKSLVCDIIEPFRPIVDYKIRKMINLGQIKNYKFKIYKEQYQLEWEYSSHFVGSILEEISDYKSLIFDFIQQYYRWFMKDEIIEKFPKVVLTNDNS